MLEMKYFVLKPKSKRGKDPYARASRCAMRAYARAIRGTDTQLATELEAWATHEDRRETIEFEISPGGRLGRGL